MIVRLPRLLWYENSTLEIDLPDDWNTEVCPMQGADSPPMTLEQMRSAINNPLGTVTLKELAAGKESAVIVFDDMTRPTRIFEIAPLVIEELVTGGIDTSDITFVCALGTHGALTVAEFRKKLGSDIVERFRVFNHNIYENCVDVGTTSRGTRLRINREVADADLKVAIGCMTAHAQTGFSGGGKIILPGVAHIASITHYHNQVEAMNPRSTGMGKYPDNILQMEIEEAATLAGLDFCINVLVNERGETAALFAGNHTTIYHQAVKSAADHYASSPIPRDKDLVISNAYVKANEMAIAMAVGYYALNNKTGTIVIIADSPEGQVVHYLLGKWGRNYGGLKYPAVRIPDTARVIIMAPHLDRNFGDWFANSETITWTRNWQETLKILRPEFGPGTNVAVIPDATMQYHKR